MSAWLSALLGRIHDLGTNIPLGYGLNFVGGVRARLNSSTKLIDVDLRDASVGLSQVAVESAGIAQTFTVRVPFTAGETGTLDDVEGPTIPVACRVIDAWVDVDVAVGGSSMRVRDTTGGGGASLSGQLSADAVGRGIRASTGGGTTVAARSELNAGETVHLRRTNDGSSGVVYLLCERI